MPLNNHRGAKTLKQLIIFSLKLSVFRTVILSVNLSLNLQSTFWCQKVAKNFSTYSISRSLPLVRKLPQAILLIRCSLAMCGILAFIRCCETRICKQLLKHSRTFSYKCSATHSALECAALYKVTLHRKQHHKERESLIGSLMRIGKLVK